MHLRLSGFVLWMLYLQWSEGKWWIQYGYVKIQRVILSAFGYGRLF